MTPTMEETRCHQCNKLICKVERGAVVTGKIEIKCRACDTLNYVVTPEPAREDVQQKR